MKQTAVEWLQQALEDTILDHEQIMQTIGLFEQAKEMEKEQMVDFANDLLAQNDANYIAVPNLAEQYYNETFNING